MHAITKVDFKNGFTFIDHVTTVLKEIKEMGLDRLRFKSYTKYRDEFLCRVNTSRLIE